MTTEVTETLDKIQQYIQETGMGNSVKRYDITLFDLFSLRRMEDGGTALAMAFDYGRAKGYRAAKAEIKRKQQRRK